MEKAEKSGNENGFAEFDAFDENSKSDKNNNFTNGTLLDLDMQPCLSINKVLLPFRCFVRSMCKNDNAFVQFCLPCEFQPFKSLKVKEYYFRTRVVFPINKVLTRVEPTTGNLIVEFDIKLPPRDDVAFVTFESKSEKKSEKKSDASDKGTHCGYSIFFGSMDFQHNSDTVATLIDLISIVYEQDMYPPEYKITTELIYDYCKIVLPDAANEFAEYYSKWGMELISANKTWSIRTVLNMFSQACNEGGKWRSILNNNKLVWPYLNREQCESMLRDKIESGDIKKNTIVVIIRIGSEGLVLSKADVDASIIHIKYNIAPRPDWLTLYLGVGTLPDTNFPKTIIIGCNGITQYWSDVIKILKSEMSITNSTIF
jgi:hypothetical protein